MRDTTIYMDGEPFRLSHDVLKPGELTQSMAVPWQADFFACAWEDNFGRGWWPAQRPDDVLMERPPHTSKPWIRGINSMHDMIRDWDKLGLVVKQTAPDGGEIFVETERDPNGVLGND
jgi:L-lysine epsilon oxidase-like protein